MTSVFPKDEIGHGWLSDIRHLFRSIDPEYHYNTTGHFFSYFPDFTILYKPLYGGGCRPYEQVIEAGRINLNEQLNK